MLATAFLSLLLPLSFLLLAAARYKSPFFLIATKTTLILLVSLVTLAAALDTIIKTKRRRLQGAWILLLFLIQVCLWLGIQGTVDFQISGYSYTVGSWALPRRLAFAVGLHVMTSYWSRNAVKPVVEDGNGDGCSGLLTAAALANLWWLKLREEAEALVVVPWVVAELGIGDVVGWLLYYSTAAIGLAAALKGAARVVMCASGKHRPA